MKDHTHVIFLEKNDSLRERVFIARQMPRDLDCPADESRACKKAVIGFITRLGWSAPAHLRVHGPGICVTSEVL